MPTEFTMPKLGLTMEEGTILEWLVADGTAVGSGTAVLRVETDKVETDVEIPDGGRLQIVGEVGTVYRCGERIGWVLGDGEVAPLSVSAAVVAPAVGGVAVGDLAVAVVPIVAVAVARRGSVVSSS